MSTLNLREYREYNIQIAQENFYHYCHLMFPMFYDYHGYVVGNKIIYPEIDHELPYLSESEKRLLIEYKNFDNLKESGADYSSLVMYENEFKKIRKKYLFDFCKALQAFYENRLVNSKGIPYLKLMVNMPPRARKTLTLKLFASWILGKDNNQKMFSITYNRELSISFGKDVRNFIEEESLNVNSIGFRDIFRDTKIKYGDAAKECWSLEGQHFTFLSTSPNSTQTGKGFNFVTVDDIIKDAKHYYNQNQIEKDWQYVNNTLLSRKENSNAKFVIVMHRWGEDDICGKYLQQEPDKWAVIKFPAYNEKHDVMLDPGIMTKADFLNRKTLTNPDIFSANYQQEIVILEGYLYKEFKTYSQDELKNMRFEFIGFYADTADQGEDYLACGFFGFYKGKCYMIDLLYTQLSAESSEIEMCDKIIENKATTGFIESNSGGHAYARNIRRLLEEKKVFNCTINEFTQVSNKEAKILANRTNVTNSIIMPQEWSLLWPEFYKHVTKAKVKQKWPHDDAMDMLSEICEKFVDYQEVKFY